MENHGNTVCFMYRSEGHWYPLTASQKRQKDLHLLPFPLSQSIFSQLKLVRLRATNHALLIHVDPWVNVKRFKLW